MANFYVSTQRVRRHVLFYLTVLSRDDLLMPLSIAGLKYNFYNMKQRINGLNTFKNFLNKEQCLRKSNAHARTDTI